MSVLLGALAISLGAILFRAGDLKSSEKIGRKFCILGIVVVYFGGFLVILFFVGAWV